MREVPHYNVTSHGQLSTESMNKVSLHSLYCKIFLNTMASMCYIYKKRLQNNDNVQIIKALLNTRDYSITLGLSCQKKKNTNRDHLKSLFSASELFLRFKNLPMVMDFFLNPKCKNFSSATTAEVEGTLSVICDYEGFFWI